MLEFIKILKNRYQAIAQSQQVDLSQNTITLERVEQLILAEAFIQKGQLIETVPKHPLQIAVIGPTQVGKSTIVNLLLNSSAAGVSALAGYTVHPQGFCVGIDQQHCDWVNHYFEGYQQVPQAKLDPDNYTSYSITASANIEPSLAKHCLVWDTPDFDSIDAAGYREGVLKTIALADMLIVVVSKEKYADQAVWDILSLIQPLDKPTMMVVNKLVPESQDMVLNSLKGKWQQARSEAFPTVIPLEYQATGKLQSWPKPIVKQISKELERAAKKSKRPQHLQNQRNYLNSHWQSWLEPVMAEYTAKADWEKMLDAVIAESLQQYKRDYLDHPRHYETFNKAILELLTLLEIPGIAKLLAKSRRILTWPIRKIFSIGQRIGKGDRGNSSQEVILLNQKADHLLIQISEKVLDIIERDTGNSRWWKEINMLLRTERTRISTTFDKAAHDYYGEFQHEIEETAQQLYQKLKEQPVILNSLRATRFTTDSVALVLAIHTGGIGLHDLIIMPVVLSVTSLLTESALGSYMKRVEAELKQKQLNTVKAKLFEAQIKTPLLNLPDAVSSAVQFNIPKHKLEEVEQQLKEKKHGLRLF